MSKKLLLSLTIMAGVLFVGASPALATGLDCSREMGQYNTGVRIGKSIVTTVWNRVGQDPDRFEEVESLVRTSVRNAIRNLDDDASRAVKCRAKGLSQGVCDGLEDVQDDVESVCLLDGQMWGSLSGDIYCALAIEFGGAGAYDLLPVAPSNLCGESFVSGCEEQFGAYVDGLAACADYDRADDQVSYESWEGGMCSYEVL